MRRMKVDKLKIIEIKLLAKFGNNAAHFLLIHKKFTFHFDLQISSMQKPKYTKNEKKC